MVGDEEENSYYSNNEEYFLDLCRVGELEELKEFVEGLKEQPFDWACISNACDNYLHMLAANNQTALYQYITPIVLDRIGGQKWKGLLNSQNSTGNTPVHYAVITSSIEMVKVLLAAGADTNIRNDCERTAFAEAEEFDKFDIAEILAPLTKVNVEAMKKEAEVLAACNEDSDEDQEREREKLEVKKQEPRECPDQ